MLRRKRSLWDLGPYDVIDLVPRYIAMKEMEPLGAFLELVRRHVSIFSTAFRRFHAAPVHRFPRGGSGGQFVNGAVAGVSEWGGKMLVFLIDTGAICSFAALTGCGC